MHILNVFLLTLYFNLELVKCKRKILNGVDTQIEQYPFMASLQKNGHHSCGGAIISPNTVLTAAHCLIDLRPNSRTEVVPTIVVGETYKYKIVSGQKYEVDEFMEHPEFSMETAMNDIALIKIKGQFEFGDNVKVIEFSSAQPKTATILGWGLTDNGEDNAKQLQVATIPLITLKECREKYGSIQMDDKLTENSICAGDLDLRIDSCSGDSGGPLISNGKLIGVVSWGVECGHPEFPGVYVNVTTYIPWILKNTK